MLARRGASVLKRLRAGELSDGEITIGVAGPSTLVSLAGTAVAMVVGGLVGHLPWPAHLLLLLLGLVGGIVVLAPLAALTTVPARTAEGAQYAARPVVILSGLSSGTMTYMRESLPDLAPSVGVLACRRWFRWEPRR